MKAPDCRSVPQSPILARSTEYSVRIPIRWSFSCAVSHQRSVKLPMVINLTSGRLGLGFVVARLSFTPFPISKGHPRNTSYSPQLFSLLPFLPLLFFSFLATNSLFVLS